MTSEVWTGLIDSFDDTKGWANRPLEWSRNKAGSRLWSKQRDIKTSVFDNRYTACMSCHDSGKSFVAADIAAWWVDSHPVGTAFVVTTAPTAAQVKTVLWQEITKIHERAELAGRINRGSAPEWFIGSTQVGLGRKPADYNVAAFSGIHALYPLVIIDEAGGVSRAIFDAVDTFATNRNARVLAIGNPDDPTSYFAKVCEPSSDWNVINIDGLRTPNMTREMVEPFPLLKALMEAEGIPYSTEATPSKVRDVLLSPDWVEERIVRWAGVARSQATALPKAKLAKVLLEKTNASQLFTAKVRGQFPPIGGGTNVIPLGWVEAAINRWMDWDDAGRVEQIGRRIVGVDVARTGSDQTVLAVRQGMVIERLDKSNQPDTMETANYAAGLVNWPRSLAVVDVIGIGAGVLDRLREMQREGRIGGEAIGFNASANSGRTDRLREFRFLNDRAAAWWRMRELLDPSQGSTVLLPPDDDLKEELVAPQWSLRTGGVIVVEEKKDVKDRIGRSTDSADAVIQAFWVDGLDAGHIEAGHESGVMGNPVKWAEKTAEGVIRYAGYDAIGDTEDDDW